MYEFLAALLIVGSMGFWVMACVVFMFIMALSENDSPFWGLTVLVVFMAILNFAGTTDTWALIKDQPWIVAEWTIYYFAAGAVWSAIKWTMFSRKLAEQYRGLRNKFCAKYDLDDLKVPLDLQSELASFVFTEGYRATNDAPSPHQEANNELKFDPRPSARAYASKFTHWIIWWPTSFIWTLFDDFFVKVAKVIRELFQGVYARITTFMFRDLMD